MPSLVSVPAKRGKAGRNDLNYYTTSIVYYILYCILHYDTAIRCLEPLPVVERPLECRRHPLLAQRGEGVAPGSKARSAFFDWDVPVLDWAVPVFDWEVRCAWFDLEAPFFNWEAPVFDLGTAAFDWEAPIFDLGNTHV